MLGFLKNDAGKSVHVNEIDELIGKVELIDIREPYEYQRGSLKTAKNIPMGDIVNAPANYLDKDKAYYIMCQSGGRSSQTCKFLTKQGYDVINVVGGVGAYVGNKKK